MAIFEYSALTSSGRLMKGTIEAGSRQQAGQLLEEMQLTVNEIEKAKRKKPKTAIGRSEFLLFNQQLASITKAGIPLERALRQLTNDVASRSMRKLITAVADELEAGVSIDEAIKKRQKHFPMLYEQILKAGVQTGRLSEMLTSLNRHLEMAGRTRRIIFEAITYPAIVFALAAMVITGVFLFIIPQFKYILGEMTEGAELPKLTQMFLAGAENVVPFWTTVFAVIAVMIVISLLLSTSAAGRRFKESVFLKLPIMGRLYHNTVLARLSEAMAMLINAGSDMPTCLRLSAVASGSEKLKLESRMLTEQLENGAEILEAGHFCRMIPRLFLYSVQLGAQRNELQDNLYGLGQMYTEQGRFMQARLQAILLPIMIIVVGVFVGTAVLALFLPMVTIITSLM